MKINNLTGFVLLVFLISWPGVLPDLLAAHGVDVPDALGNLDILMTLGPILAAIVYIGLTQRLDGLKRLFGRLLRFRAAPGVIAFSLLLPIVLAAVAATAGLALSETGWPERFDAGHVIRTGLMVTAGYLVINTEEIVWRGVVFDRLFDALGFVKACLVLTPIWWLFHIPLFLFPDGHPAGYGMGAFTLIVIGQTFILGWIYVRTRRSLVYVHLHHQLNNGFGQAFPIFPVFIAGAQAPVWVYGLTMVLVAAACVRIGVAE